MQKQRALDLLKNKIPSRFLCVVDDSYRGSAEFLWHCMLREALLFSPCLIVSSGLYSYERELKASCFSSKCLMMDDFDDIDSLLEVLRKNISSTPEVPHCSLHILIDCLSWFLLDCPSDFEFEFWTRHVIAVLFAMSLHPCVRRITVLFHPLKSRDGTLLSGSSDVVSILEQCSVTFVRCESSVLPCAGNSAGRIQQAVSLWHRCALQGFYAVGKEQLRMVNKPTFLERVLIEIDPLNWVMLSQSPKPSSEIRQLSESKTQPESSFALQMTETEKQARSKVVLPYELGESKLIESEHKGGEACVHYQPDCFDDLDDEDPDDDLNI
ncbi:uncharacterized protein DEA37_0009889 [Paragonimus westermani]|uniref:Elongator complex protein 5 n=1 Tax=Paragonimus westermani TaxID=34504 RepID=A0A5J4NF32_9TREM|nr:uncharacterized protein DEA37_0009889 [Paragonimus westermani]